MVISKLTAICNYRSIARGGLMLALIVGFAGSPAAAALVQITLIGNQNNSVSPVIDLDADVTGDGVDDITILAGSSESNPWTAYASINGTVFDTYGGTYAGSGGYTIDGGAGGSGMGNPMAGVTYFMPITFTDTGYSPGPVEAILEIRAQGHEEDPALSGIFLRRLIFDLNAGRGGPTGYSEFVSYPEAERIDVPEPASAAIIVGLLGAFCSRRP